MKFKIQTPKKVIFSGNIFESLGILVIAFGMLYTQYFVCANHNRMTRAIYDIQENRSHTDNLMINNEILNEARQVSIELKTVLEATEAVIDSSNNIDDDGSSSLPRLTFEKMYAYIVGVEGF